MTRTYKEEFLGDGVYVPDVGGSIRLRAPRADGDNLIYQPSHLAALIAFAKRTSWIEPESTNCVTAVRSASQDHSGRPRKPA